MKTLREYIDWVRSVMKKETKPAEQSIQAPVQIVEITKPKRTYKKKDGTSVPKV